MGLGLLGDDTISPDLAAKLQQIDSGARDEELLAKSTFVGPPAPSDVASAQFPMTVDVSEPGAVTGTLTPAVAQLSPAQQTALSQGIQSQQAAGAPWQQILAQLPNIITQTAQAVATTKQQQQAAFNVRTAAARLAKGKGKGTPQFTPSATPISFKEQTDYTWWIVGGVAAVALLGFGVMATKRK